LDGIKSKNFLELDSFTNLRALRLDKKLKNVMSIPLGLNCKETSIKVKTKGPSALL